MSPYELVARGRDQVRHWTFRRHQLRPGRTVAFRAPVRDQRFSAVLSPRVSEEVPASAAQALVRAADGLLEGRWEVLGVSRTDLVAPDWFADPVTGRSAPRDLYAFRIDHRAEDRVGNVKQIWELSRHHHVTVLAAAWFVTGRGAYAERAAEHLRSWWRENPNLSGIHWTSGIELGVRLIAWTWCRRLLDAWPGVRDLFEHNPLALDQLFWHQRYLAAFCSRGSSANNHVIAEAAGQLVAACAFPWFDESAQWRGDAARLLERELERNTFPSGVNRELASDYQGFVAELGLIAALEARAAGHALGDATWTRLCAMLDATAAILDEGSRAPRQGDGDDGRALVLDAPEVSRWSSLLDLGASVFGPLSWWPTPAPSVFGTILAGLGAPARNVSDRPPRRPSHFADAGLTLLRTPRGEVPEIWCRCDGGPHGYLSIAAHAHADALSVEVRYGGIDVLADPGTYCYHGAREWRAYFRSTLGHNTVELAGRDQSQSGGPFLWVRHAGTRVIETTGSSDGEIASWTAEHDGYSDLDPPAIHRRTVHLDRARRRLDIVDRIQTTGAHPLRLAFHLGPSVRAHLADGVAHLEWATRHGAACASMWLPDRLRWMAHRAVVDPVRGWYSAGFGLKQPSTTLIGTGICDRSDGELTTSLRFADRSE